MEDTVFSPKERQTAEIPSSLNPNSIDQVEDREMAGWNKRRPKVTGSCTLPAATISDLQRRDAPLSTCNHFLMSAEKAGVGGWPPSLATMFSDNVTLLVPAVLFPFGPNFRPEIALGGAD